MFCLAWLLSESHSTNDSLSGGKCGHANEVLCAKPNELYKKSISETARSNEAVKSIESRVHGTQKELGNDEIQFGTLEAE